MSAEEAGLNLLAEAILVLDKLLAEPGAGIERHAAMDLFRRMSLSYLYLTEETERTEEAAGKARLLREALERALGLVYSSEPEHDEEPRHHRIVEPRKEKTT